MLDPRISDPQCGTIREAGIKSKEIWRYNKTGGAIRESGTIREKSDPSVREILKIIKNNTYHSI